MSDERRFHEMNENELEQVSGGTRIGGDFRCPVCGTQQHFLQTACEIGEEGPTCAQCRVLRGQDVRMIRIH